MKTQIRSVALLVLSTTVCLLVGVSGAIVTSTSVAEWYPHIQKPWWTPPSAAFGPVWTVLYLLMGVSAWMIGRKSVGLARRNALLIFAAQLALNGTWSFLFFGLRSPGWAALEIALLWFSIVATMTLFARISRLSAGLLVPYLLWVSYAAALNFAIWTLN